MSTANSYSPYPAFNGRNTPQMAPQPSHPRPMYFLSRSNGLLVPLIPADELPFNVRLQGVQRVMQFEQTYGMQHVGNAPYTGMTFKLEDDMNPMQRSSSQPPTANHGRSQSSATVNPIKQYLAPDALARQALAQSANNQVAAAANTAASAMSQRPVSAHETATTWRSNIPTSAPPTTPPANPMDRTQHLIDAIVSSTSGAAEAARIGYIPKPTSTPPSGAQPDQDKKEYCTYWIRKGECDYTQQGCLYKHEMPDKVTLEKIGLRGTPRWWLEKQSAVKLAGNGGGGEKASAGPIVKSEVWLKKMARKEGEDEEGEESGSEASLESEASSVGSASTKAVVATTAKKPLTLEPATKTPPQAKKEAAPEKEITHPAKKSTPTRAPPPTPVDIRKTSTTSDLIDFATPLLPTPPSSTPSLTPSNSAESSPRTGQSTPLTPPTPPTTTFHDFAKKASKPVPTMPTSTTRVFVPKGESPDHHIAEAKKLRAARHQQQTRRAAAPASSAIGGAVQPGLAKQIQEAHKARHPQGLMASMHAPAPAPSTAAAAANGELVPTKRTNKAGCRVRRPAAASTPAPPAPVGAAKAAVTILKKEEEGGALK